MSAGRGRPCWTWAAERLRIASWRGGALNVSHIASYGAVPAAIRRDMELWAACTAGAMDKADYLATLRAAAFRDISVVKEMVYDYQRGPDYGFASVTVRAVN